MARSNSKSRRRRGKRRKATKTDTMRGVIAVRLKDGTVRYRASIPGGRRGVKTWTPLVDTAEKAGEIRRRTMQKVDAMPAHTVTFGAAVKAVRDDYAERCRPATLQWFNYQVPALEAFFGKMLVSSIRKQDVERFVSQQLGAKLSPGTVHHRRRGLRAILSKSADQLVNGDPMKGVKWPKVKRGKVTAPEPAAIRDFLTKTIDSGSPRARQDHDIVAAIFLTGLRRSELARLRCEDLRPDEGRIFVRGKTADDWLPVNAEAVAVLERMAERVERKGELVPGGVEEIVRVLKTRSTRNKIHLTPHALRRAFVTALIRGGHDVATVARYSRHKSDEIQRYMAANEDDRRVLAAVTLEGPLPKKKGRARLRKVR